MLVRLVINATYSAILYDYRRGGNLAHISGELAASTVAEKSTPTFGNTIRLLRAGFALSFFVGVSWFNSC